MALDHGTGTSRTLSPLDRAFASVIWQKGKPPLDAELNLMGSVEMEQRRQYIAGLMPSGFLMDPTRAAFDFKFDKLWINHFHLGVPRAAQYALDADETQPVVWANVGGWIIPVAGTDITGAAEVHNVVKLYPAPGSDARTDFVFLEAWATLVQPNPSDANKPTASTIWKYGNVKHGGTNITDDLEDPKIGFETSKRVQIQYRIRVYGSGVGGGAGVNLAVHPDGFGDPNILGQGAATGVVAGMQWTNMREQLGDPSLWRAGDGDPNNALGSIDGYTYAIPICAVFRRCVQTYVAVKQSGNPTQNGATVRTPGVSSLVDPLTGAVPLLQASLGAHLGPDDGKLADFTIAVTNLNGSGLEDTSHTLSSIFLKLDDEIVGISAVDLVNNEITIPAGGRGRWGTAAVGHDTGTLVSQFNTRPDGLYADEVAAQDILDLRRAVNPGDWDYNRLLAHNVAALAKGTLRTAWKESNPGDTEGPVVHEVAEMYAGGVDAPNHTDPVDGPDGIRTIWSDGAVLQPDVTMLLAHDATSDADHLVGFTNAGLDTNVEWDVGASFNPIGFMNNGALAAGWYNGSSIHLFIGGTTGELGARATFRSAGVRDVRFVTPKEYWKTGYPIVDVNTGNQHPVTLRFLGEKLTVAAPATAADKASYPGPMYPWRETGFERPFIVLGGLLHDNLHIEALATATLTTAVDAYGVTRYYMDLTGKGIDFDTAGVFHNASGGVFPNDPAQVATPLLRGERTLYGMLTNNGRDRTGASSEVYVLTYGDPAGRNNNGVFRVIGAGTTDYTQHLGVLSGMLVLEPLSGDFAGFDGNANSVTVDFRSQWTNADDTASYATRVADCVIALTDIAGEAGDGTPWDTADLPAELVLGTAGGAHYAPSKMVLSTTLLYHPGRSATARVPDELVRFAMRGGSEETLGTYLRRSPSGIDTTFSAIGTATDETYWPTTHIQTWNRLPALGWPAPLAPSYGGAVVGFTEQDRESECFVDRGSKTLLFRPFRNRDMTLRALTWPDPEIPVDTCLLGSYTYPDATVKESLQILTGTAGGGGYGVTGKRMGFPVPHEFMPRFGRQDIPYRQLNTGAAPTAAGFMPGINHLFTDVTDVTNPVFNIIGGERNAGGSEVNSLFLVTRASQIAYAHSDPSYGVKNVGAYGARKTTVLDPTAGQNTRDVIAALAEVNSSDFGRGLKGIQLPPYMGIARLYGVYEYEDYVAKGATAFKSNRYEMEDNSAVNLLREDAHQQTLFILQDGAKDLTTETGDHTYIIPSNVLDLTRIPAAPGGTPVHAGYVEGTSVFEDFDYVVECTVFFFAKGWINETNVVLCRERNGSYGLNTDGDNPELENVPMCIPSPAGINDRFYSAYNRTVYQGDPFMTRDGDTRQEADYENRYGRLTVAQANNLRTAVQQFDSAGNFVPQMGNPRGFEVLASMDFYTTLGTGKVGGTLFPGTSLDVGHIEATLLASSRMPLADDANDWRINVRAFSEGQKENTSRAKATVEVLDNRNLSDAHGWGDTFFVRFTLLDNTVVTLYGATNDYYTSTLMGLGLAAQDHFEVDVASEVRDTIITYTTLAPITLDPSQIGVTYLVPFAAADPTTQVATVSLADDDLLWHTPYGGVVLSARVLTSGGIAVDALLTISEHAFDTYPGILGSVRTYNNDFGAVGALGNLTDTMAWTGVALSAADHMVLVQPDSTVPAGIHYEGYVSGADTITIKVVNSTGAPIDPPPVALKVAVLKKQDAGDWNATIAQGLVFKVHVVEEVGSKNATADNLVAAINAHTRLGRSVKAFNDGTPKVTVESVPTGAEGNGIRIEVGRADWAAAGPPAWDLPMLQNTLKVAVPSNNELPSGHHTTGTNLYGGVDLPVNAGIGTSQMTLTGMTERLPLGVLVQDSDFLCENPLGDDASAMNSAPATLRPIQTLMPLIDSEEYSRFMGAPGELIAMADGIIAPNSWAAWTSTSGDTATKKFRLYRGGGSAFVLSGDNPGGPIDWVSESFPKSSRPVLKGGILACKALLVRNYYEEAFSGGSLAKVSDGDEIQLVIITNAHFGDGLSVQNGITLDGIISPSGYGEGYAAADRYRCMGRPMFRGYSRVVPNPSQVTLAVYPEDTRGS